jgi:hypothetical protein
MSIVDKYIGSDIVYYWFKSSRNTLYRLYKFLNHWYFNSLRYENRYGSEDIGNIKLSSKLGLEDEFIGRHLYSKLHMISKRYNFACTYLSASRKSIGK